MFELDFNHPIHIHFIGIGGISMSGLAEVLINSGFIVSGSDNQESDLTRALIESGASVFYGQKRGNIPSDCDAVVYTAAIHPDNPEFAEAVERNIPMLTRAELLGQLMKKYKTSIAVAGTHGKTTTTSMISHILLNGKYDPTISVGGILPAIGGNIKVGNSDYFITEACEYTDSYLSFNPTLSVILNVEADHLDYFKTYENVRISFKNFAKLLPENGHLVINADIEDTEFFTKELTCPFTTYSVKNPADLGAKDIKYDKFARATFTCTYKGEEYGVFSLNVPGAHNIENALAAIGAGIALGIDKEVIKAGLKDFTGTNRRFQIIGEYKGCTIVDDYAHHPTEVRACLNTAANYPHEKLWCVFQPHTYTRTASFLDEFSSALSLADEVILSDIYAARETNEVGVSSDDIVKRITNMGKKAIYIPEFKDIANYLKDKLGDGDLLITMGAGESYKVAGYLEEMK